MDVTETDRDLTDPAWRRWTLLGSLIVLGLLYIFSYGLFTVRSENFIVGQRNERAMEFSSQHPFTLPARLSFGVGEKDNPRLGGGWHLPESGGVWSAASNAWIEVVLPRTDVDVLLRLNATALVSEHHAATKLEVTINGVPAGSWVRTIADASEPLDIRVPRGPLQRRRLAVCLQTDYVDSPVRMRIGEDVRELGVLLRSIELRSDPL